MAGHVRATRRECLRPESICPSRGGEFPQGEGLHGRGANGYGMGRRGAGTRWRRLRLMSDGGPDGVRVANGQRPIIDWCDMGINRIRGGACVNPKGRAERGARDESREYLAGSTGEQRWEYQLTRGIMRRTGKRNIIKLQTVPAAGEKALSTWQERSEREAVAPLLAGCIQVR